MCFCLPSKTEFQEGGIRLSSFAESLEEAHSRCLINFCWITLCKPNSLSIDDPTRGSPQLLLTTTSALHSTWPFSASSQIEISVLLQVQIFVRENLIGFFRISHSLLSQSAVAEAGWLSEAVAYLRREKLVIFSTCAGLSMVSGALSSHPQALAFQFPDFSLPIAAFLCLRDYLGTDICPIPAQIADSKCWKNTTHSISSQSNTEENWYINAPAPCPWSGTILSVYFAMAPRVPQW